MKLRPLLLSFARRRKANGVIEDGRTTSSEAEKTCDGTLDVYGRPASRRTTGGWKGASFVLVEQVMANLAFFGVSTNLVIYLTTIMHESNSSAAKNVGNWYGTGYIAPLLAAFVADSYSGRFLGAVISSVVYIAALAMLTVAGTVHSFRPPQCPSKDVTCQHATPAQGAFLYAGLYIMDFGAGGVQGTVVAFGADQFDEEDDKEKRQKSSYFNYVYQTILVGSFISSTFFVYIQENVSAGLGWGISGAVLVLGTIALLTGVRSFRYHNPGGNPLVRIAQVVVAFLRKRQAKVSSVDGLYEVHDSQSVIEGSRRIQHSNKFGFLDKAAIVTESDKERGLLQNPWHVCTVTQVEEVKFVLRVLPVFLTSIMYTTCYGQLTTLFVVQGYSMDRQLGSFVIPAASLAVFECLSVFFWVAVYDKLFVPFLRMRTGNHRGISELKRIGIGLVLSILSMVIAAVVEIQRLHTARVHGLLDDTTTPVPMSVFWEIPQYFVMGASEVFTYIGLMEFFYDQAPDAIRSLGSSISLLTNAIGYFISTLLLTIVGNITTRGGNPGWIADNLNRGRIDLFYWLLVVMSFVNLLIFILCAQRYEYIVTQGPITRAAEAPCQQKGEQEAQLESSHNPEDF